MKRADEYFGEYQSKQKTNTDTAPLIHFTEYYILLTVSNTFQTMHMT